MKDLRSFKDVDVTYSKTHVATYEEMFVRQWTSAAFMVLTFSYSRIIAGRYFDPRSRLLWVSKIGRIFIMVLIGYQAGNTLRGEGFNGLIRFLQIIIVRTKDALLTRISPF